MPSRAAVYSPSTFDDHNDSARPTVAVVSQGFADRHWRDRAHQDFPLRAFVRCVSCGRGLTGSWSKGRSEYYAYYHCRQAVAQNVTKAKLEGLFADELTLLQPTPGYMRLLKESVLQIWKRGRRRCARRSKAPSEL